MIPVLGAELRHSRQDVDCGVVDQYVDSAASLNNLGEYVIHLFAVGNIHYIVKNP